MSVSGKYLIQQHAQFAVGLCFFWFKRWYFLTVCRATWRWRRANIRNLMRGFQILAGKMQFALPKSHPILLATYWRTLKRMRPAGKRLSGAGFITVTLVYCCQPKTPGFPFRMLKNRSFIA